MGIVFGSDGSVLRRSTPKPPTRHLDLDIEFANNLTMAELRRALRSPKIKRVTIEIRIQFGEEPVEIEIPKSTVLAQLGGGNDEAETEAQIFESNPSTVAFI